MIYHLDKIDYISTENFNPFIMTRMYTFTRNLNYVFPIVGIMVFAIFSSTFSPVLVAQGVTYEHIAKMKTVTSSTISDDGKYVAYTVSVPADPLKENVGNTTQLHVLEVVSGKTTPYFTLASVGGVTFRPGSGSITFLSTKPGETMNAIYEISIHGGEATKLFAFSSRILQYKWHTDGNNLAFIASESGKAPVTPLPYKPTFYEENFSKRNAYITDLNKDDHEPAALNIEGYVYNVVWSPDKSKLAISAAPTASVDDSYMNQRVMIVDANTREVITQIPNEGKLGNIIWSPDSKRLALLAGKDINDPIEGRILIVSAQGGKPQMIDHDYKGKYEQIFWTETNTIHFLGSESTQAVIGTVRPDGTGKNVIFKTGEHAITSFSRATNGSISMVASSPNHPAELFTLSNVAGAKPVKKTNHNAWIAEVQLGKQEVISYTARDGAFDIEGLLMYPLDYESGTRVPVITVVHGGPEAHYSNGWLTSYSSPGQMAAAKGYAVFYPNYRGSTGRGVEFIYSSQGDLAGKEFDDIVDGIDYLIDRGIADKDRVGVTGGSYGGYASAWMSTYYSDRFAAAVMFVGISNNISKWGTSDIPEELYHVHSRKRIWEDWQWQLQRSPVYYVDRSQTPILIMHGADDPRVHPAQSMELYRHLKVRKPDLPVRLIYYPGEGHGNQKSGSKYDYNLRMLQWFDTYLMSGDPTAEKPGLDLPVKKD